MGGDGSGRYSIVSKSFDIVDAYWTTLNYCERSLYDGTKKITAEWIDTEKQNLRRLQDQFRMAVERTQEK